MKCNWKEFNKKISEAVIQKNDLYYELIKKGVLIKYESDSQIKHEPELATIWEE